LIKVSRSLSVEQVAAIVSTALRDSGVTAVLCGGSVVSIYSDNEYQSADLDFVTAADHSRLAKAMKTIGFARAEGRYYHHPDCEFVIEFPSAPVSLGNELVQTWSKLSTPVGDIEILSPTQCVKDRLAAFYHWNDRQCLDQAVMVARRHRVKLSEIDAWSKSEGKPDAFKEFQTALRNASRAAKARK
jgi:hypothetical protein